MSPPSRRTKLRLVSPLWPKAMQMSWPRIGRRNRQALAAPAGEHDRSGRTPGNDNYPRFDFRALTQISRHHDRCPRWIRAPPESVLSPVGHRTKAVSAGWRRTELADALGIEAPAAQKRVQAARERYGDIRPALLIDGPPRRRQKPLGILKTPVAEREWLSLDEVIAFTRHSAEVIKQWRQYGLLPNTQRVAPTRLLYLRADLRRVLSAPRRGEVGIDREALLATIRAAPV